MSANLPKTVSIVIPTLDRGRVLIETIQTLLDLSIPADEILIVDQTAKHDAATDIRLASWHREGRIRLIRQSERSITKAMNTGLRLALSQCVLFLDDDIRPRAEIVSVHAQAHRLRPELWATVGQVIQPWQSPTPIRAPRKYSGLRTDDDFPFHSIHDMETRNVMAGNLCVNRDRALSLGGFDENFQGSAYRFESDFARRVYNAGGRIQFLGNAGVDHLRISSGGTRVKGSHLRSGSPLHGIGDHYFALVHAESRSAAMRYCLRRIVREVRTKFHLTHPWWIPVKLAGEVRAFCAARRLLNQEH